MGLPTILLKGTIDAGNNPQLKTYYSENRAIDVVLKWFNDRMSKTGIENRHLVLVAQTASGKSTAFPAELYQTFISGKRGPGVICTQPRVFNTINIPSQILKNYTKFKLGDTIGWSTGFNKLRPRSYGLLFATIGTLTQQLKSMSDQKIMELYRFILIDETHERSIEIDMALYMLKNFLVRNSGNPNCPFVVMMSATIVPDKYLKYFNGTIEDNYFLVLGSTYPVEMKWDLIGDKSVANFHNEIGRTIEHIMRTDTSTSQSDILVFVPGDSDIRQVKRLAEALNEKLYSEGKKPAVIIELSGRTNSTGESDQVELPLNELSVFVKGGKAGNGTFVTPCRRLCIGTAAVETGVTLDDLKYVIDSGYSKELEFNPYYGVALLISKPETESRLKQRRGRVGRKFPGIYYPIFPKKIYEMMEKQQYPEIIMKDISDTLLAIIIAQLRVKQKAGAPINFLTKDIDMVDLPTYDSLLYAIETNYTLGFISPRAPIIDLLNDDVEAALAAVNPEGQKTWGVTKLGLLASLVMTKNNSKLIKMVMSSFYWNVSTLDVITIAAYLMGQTSDFTVSRDTPVDWNIIYQYGLPSYFSDQKSALRARLLFADTFMDGLFLFYAIKHIMLGKNKMKVYSTIREFCDRAKINMRAVMSFMASRDEMIEQYMQFGINIFSNESESLDCIDEENLINYIVKIKYCIYEGFKTDILKLSKTGSYMLSNIDVGVPPLFKDTAGTRDMNAVLGGDPNILLKPKKLVYFKPRIVMNRQTRMYKFSLDLYSALDGFVNDDETFLS